MAYNEQLAARVRNALAARPGISERKMFGGISFMLRGKMCCGVVKDDLLIRIDPEHFEQALAQPHARPMDFTGRIMRGFVYVGPGGYAADAALSSWLQRAADFAASLPAKSAKGTSRTAKPNRALKNGEFRGAEPL